jgi:hypothetical protein
MAADVCRGRQPFAFGDVGETTMPEVAQREVTGVFLAHDGACSGSEGLEIVKAREDAASGWSDRLEGCARPRREPERAAVAFLVDVRGEAKELRARFVVLGHFELVHRLTPDAELGGERCERLHRMPGSAALREAVDDSLTDINDAGCLGNCIGDPVNALGAPNFVPGQGGTTVALGPDGMLGLIFDPPCFVDNDPNTRDILVYEQGGVQVEDFFVEAAIVGGPLTGARALRSTATVNQPERRLDLTRVIGDGESGGSVDRIQIVDIAANGDEVEQGGRVRSRVGCRHRCRRVPIAAVKG